MAERGDPIIDWGEITVTLYGPLAIEEIKVEEGEEHKDNSLDQIV